MSMDGNRKLLLDAVDLDDEEQVIRLLQAGDGEHWSTVANSKLSLPGWSGFTLLLWAAQTGHVRSISLLLAAGAAIDAVDDNGDSALHHAARSRRTAAFDCLLHASPSPDLNARNRDGSTPLHLAVESGSAKIIKLLACAPSLRPNLQNRRGDSPLLLAARSGNSLALKLILMLEAVDSSLCNADGDSALHLAVASRRIISIEALLLCKNAPGFLDARNKAHLTPLLLACGCSFSSHMAIHATARKIAPVKEIVELLIQEGADVNARDKQGNTAIHLASCHGNVDAIMALLGSDSEGLLAGHRDNDTTRNSDNDTARNSDQSSALPPKDQNPSIRSRKKTEFLTWVSRAMEAEQMDEISPSPNRKEYFYSTEWNFDRVPSSPVARVNLPNRNGDTALHLAARHGRQAVAEALLDLHADVNCINYLFESPLDYAFGAKHDRMVALLISRGAELSDQIKHALVEQAVGEVGRNPLLPKPRGWDLQDNYLLHTIAMAGRPRILEALLQREESCVNVRNEWKQTPLHCAAILGKIAVVMSLAKRPELKANTEDKNGKTALEYAIECRHSEVEKLLLERMDVKESMDRLYRDRQVYIDAANAILVGAALIGGVTYAGWLQPPLGYLDQGFAVISSLEVRIFCVFNSLSFCFAMCTVLAGAGAVLPCPDVYIGSVVKVVRRSLAVAAFLMVLSVLCVLSAFTAAGFAVVKVPGQEEGTFLMAASVSPGISMAIVLMFWFVTKLFELLPGWCHVLVLRSIHFCCRRSSVSGLWAFFYPGSKLREHSRFPAAFTPPSPSSTDSGD